MGKRFTIVRFEYICHTCGMTTHADAMIEPKSCRYCTEKHDESDLAALRALAKAAHDLLEADKKG